MTLDEITEGLRKRVGDRSPIEAIVKFDFGDEGVVRIDGTASPTVIDNEDGHADCTVRVTTDDLIQLASGAMKPQMAFLAGKLRVEGDISLAMRLNDILRAKPVAPGADEGDAADSVGGGAW